MPELIAEWRNVVEAWDDRPSHVRRESPLTWSKMYRARWKFVPWQRLRHRFVRCAECGRRMNKAARFSYGGTDDVWHDQCMQLRHLRSDRLNKIEVIDRLLTLLEVETKEQIRAAVVLPDDAREQFSLWYQTNQDIKAYRADGAERWKAPNEHLMQGVEAQL